MTSVDQFNRRRGGSRVIATVLVVLTPLLLDLGFQALGDVVLASQNATSRATLERSLFYQVHQQPSFLGLRLLPALLGLQTTATPAS